MTRELNSSTKQEDLIYINVNSNIYSSEMRVNYCFFQLATYNYNHFQHNI